MSYREECQHGMFGGEIEIDLFPLCYTCEWSRDINEPQYNPMKCYCKKYFNKVIGKPSYLAFETDPSKCEYYKKGKPWTEDELGRVGQIMLAKVKKKYPQLFK